MAAIRASVEALLSDSPDPRQVWKVLDYLSEKQRELDSKYDYRYSVLIGVFGRLKGEGWLSDAELDGLGAEKRELIVRVASVYEDFSAGVR